MKRYQEIWSQEVFIDAIVFGNLTILEIKYQDNEPKRDT